jgi:hypothetical protein
MRPPPVLHLAAFSTRFQLVAVAPDGCLFGLERELEGREACLCPLDDALGELVEADVLEMKVPLAAAGELDDVGDECCQLVELSGDIAQEAFAVAFAQRDALAEEVDVRAQARERSAQFVRGVGDELPLRADRSLERVEHGVERRPEAAELVVGIGLDPLAQVVRVGDPLGCGGERAHGPKRTASDDGPDERGERDSGEAGDSEAPAEPAQRIVDVAQRASGNECAPGSERTHVHPQLGSVDLDVGVVGAPPRPSHLDRPLGDREEAV